MFSLRLFLKFHYFTVNFCFNFRNEVVQITISPNNSNEFNDSETVFSPDVSSSR